jgi:DNA mismatch endonuclease (patch repair protein)
MDRITKKQRSRLMSRIRDKNTRPEIMVRSLLHRAGLRFRLHGSSLPGSPDIVLPKYGTVVFVHGCFWHRHGCGFASTPKSNIRFWRNKFRNNVKRDGKVQLELRSLGWNVIVIWECQIGNKAIIRNIMRKIRKGKRCE